MPVFSIPLSGLTASSEALSAIANNLANLNTVGYKGTRPVFEDLFYQTVGTSGSGDPVQLGAGVQVGSLDGLFTAGSLQSTGVPTDVAIMGNGFFTCQGSDGYQFTRAGDFTVNSDGVLVSEGGQPIMGYPATNGVVNTGATVGPLQLGQGQVSAPSATSTLSMSMNLDAGTATGGSFSTPMTVYDSLGASHTLNFNFTEASPGSWNYQVTLPAADTGGTGSPTVLGSGTLTFNEEGQLTSPSGPITGITLPTGTNLANGAAPLNITWDTSDSSGPLITQMASASNTSASTQDGFGGGTLSTFAVGSDGTIQGTFSNGKTTVLGQLALANFSNPQGLTRVGSNNFSATLASGAAVIGTPGSGGRGVLAGGSLELSNVDISTEFASMITAQRGFQANSRAITTFDEITQETINLVHQ